NVYARTIIESINFNSDLDSIEDQKEQWKEFSAEVGAPIHVLPYPAYVDGIGNIPKPISPENVHQYWEKGKEIILHDLPDFHTRPEWGNYHRRKYRDGAKDGVVQHAIFKDILTALRTIAGSNKRKSGRSPCRKKEKPD